MSARCSPKFGAPVLSRDGHAARLCRASGARGSARIPDGDIFSDYADEDFVDGNPCRLALTLRIKGGAAVLDFTGSDPQLTSALNVPTGSDPHHTLLLVGVYYVLCTLDPQITLNAGLTRPSPASCRKARC